jgi:hypothetical protein
MVMIVEQLGEWMNEWMNDNGKWGTRRKTAPVPPCPPKIPRDLTKRLA